MVMPPMVTKILTESVFFLALVNPISKVFILTAVAKEFGPRELLTVSLRATLVALAILLLVGLGGAYVLTVLFHVHEYSLQVAGGLLLFVIGMRALMKGRFFELEQGQRIDDISIVPLASPMIAGPATITAAISETAKLQFDVTAPAIIAALAVNFIFMLLALRIGGWLNRLHLMSALIGITGLLVAAIAVEMVLGGIGAWLRAL